MRPDCLSPDKSWVAINSRLKMHLPQGRTPSAPEENRRLSSLYHGSETRETNIIIHQPTWSEIRIVISSQNLLKDQS